MDKYLNIKIVGHEIVKAFKNSEKKNPKEPDYKGNGVAVWVNEAKPKLPPMPKPTGDDI